MTFQPVPEHLRGQPLPLRRRSPEEVRERLEDALLKAQVVAEDVELCGRCIANEHDRPEEKRELLAAIVHGRQIVEARG